MATNYNRLLSALRKDDVTSELINATDKCFPNYTLGASTPLLNHNLTTDLNFEGEPSTLFLQEQPTKMIDTLRQLAQKKSTYRLDRNKPDTAIEFICYGYEDFSGDIVISRIDIPSLLRAKYGSKTLSEIYETIFNYTTSKEENIDNMATYFDYVRNLDLENQEGAIGKMPIVLLGSTRPIIECNDHTENTPRFSDLAKSIVPGDAYFNHNFKTGILSVCPYKIVQTSTGYKFQDGSLDCVITHYNINNNNGYATPINFTNVTRCKKIDKDGQLIDVEISSSDQPNIEFNRNISKTM